MCQPMLDRDLLYPTNNLLEPGSVHVSVLKPDIFGKISVVIYPKTYHDPMDYVDVIVEIIQADIFDRTRLNVKEQGVFFIKGWSEGYTKLVYQGEELHTEHVAQIEE